MCTHKKRIINRSNHFNQSMSLYMDVPCGKCEECKNHGRKDWFVRCYYEWLNNCADGYFYTLTFNNENLPHIGLTPCFDKRLVQLFLKRLRKMLARFGVKLKYMICCEFGELRQRPHMHALFFLDKRAITAYQFYYLVEKAWTYGFVKYGDNVGRLVNSSGIQYVTKYVTKDFAYCEKYDEMYFNAVLQRYKTFLLDIQKRYPYRFDNYIIERDGDVLRCRAPKKCDDDEKRFADSITYKMRSLFNRCRPFHLQSTGLGVSAMNVSDELQFYECVPVIQNGTVIKYPMPRYIKRKLWYDCVENEIDGKKNRFVLSEDGKKHYYAVVSERITRKMQDYSSVIENVCKINWSCLELVNATLEKCHFGSVNDLQFWVNNFDLSFEMLAIFNVVFRGRVIPFDWKKVPACEEFYLEHWRDFFEYCLDGVSTWDFGKAYQLAKNDFLLIQNSLFDAHPFFQVYDDALTIFDSILVAWKSDDNKAKDKQERLAARTRQLFDNLKM